MHHWMHKAAMPPSATPYCCWLTAPPPTSLPKAMRVVAAILEHKEVSRAADRIVAAVMWKLNPVLDLMDQAADTAQEAVTDTRKAADRLYRTGEETRDELQKGMETAREDLQKLAENV